MEKSALKEECLICGAPLVYLETDEIMECAVCHSDTVCRKGEHGK